MGILCLSSPHKKTSNCPTPKSNIRTVYVLLTLMSNTKQGLLLTYVLISCGFKRILQNAIINQLNRKLKWLNIN